MNGLSLIKRISILDQHARLIIFLSITIILGRRMEVDRPETASALQMGQRRKSHGNRKNQRFRRRCRARGMRTKKIERLLQHRQRQRKSRHEDQHAKESTTSKANEQSKTASQPLLTTTLSHGPKRKRETSSQTHTATSKATIPNSASSISIVLPPAKRTKEKTTATTVHRSFVQIDDQRMNKNYRFVPCSSSMIAECHLF